MLIQLYGTYDTIYGLRSSIYDTIFGSSLAFMILFSIQVQHLWYYFWFESDIYNTISNLRPTLMEYLPC